MVRADGVVMVQEGGGLVQKIGSPARDHPVLTPVEIHSLVAENVKCFSAARRDHFYEPVDCVNREPEEGAVRGGRLGIGASWHGAFRRGDLPAQLLVATLVTRLFVMRCQHKHSE